MAENENLRVCVYLLFPDEVHNHRQLSEKATGQNDSSGQPTHVNQAL